jgi:DNA-directed RNA polymerase specialized sigma24 family protein
VALAIWAWKSRPVPPLFEDLYRLLDRLGCTDKARNLARSLTRWSSWVSYDWTPRVALAERGLLKTVSSGTGGWEPLFGKPSDLLPNTMYEKAGNEQGSDRLRPPASFQLDWTVEVAAETDQLGEISTHWSVLDAASGTGETARAAMEAVVIRYDRAIRRYLGARLGAQDAVEDVYQEFVTQFIEKKLGACRPRGPFRYYIKGVLDNLIADYHRKRKRWLRWRRKSSEHSNGTLWDREAEEKFNAEWRQQLISAAWQAFQAAEQSNGPSLYYMALKLRVKYPKARSHELAEKLSQYVKKPVNETYYRKLLERARTKFFAYLVEEVRRSLGEPTEQEVEEELRALGLFDYYVRKLKGP